MLRGNLFNHNNHNDMSDKNSVCFNMRYEIEVRVFIFLTCVLTLLSVAQGSKILIVFCLPSKSHYILGISLARGLIEAGHDITMITRFTDKPPEGKGTFRYITISDCTKTMMGGDENTEPKFNYFDVEKSGAFINIPFMNIFGEHCSENVFKSETVQKLLNSNEKFDIVIAEALFTDSLLAFGCHFNAPTILLTPVGAATWINNVVGNPGPPSYIPNTFLTFPDNMSFWERSINTGMELLYKLNLELYFYPRQDKIIKQYFPKCPSIYELHKNVALILSNSHESVNFPSPRVPNMVDIGGYHINPVKKLSPDWQKLLDNAKNGVIYFSLGSHVKPSQMKQETKQSIMKVLGSLKETVIWKWDEDDLPGKPANFIVGKWFPQQELLWHPNVKLFITHAGMLSLTEAIYIGVPILALPVLGDQKMNAMKAEILGIGKSLSFSDLTEENFRGAVTELLTNQKYTENVKHRSALIRDRPIPPLDLAVYWVEFVIKHKGAAHLRVLGADLPWYKYFLIDVIVVWSFVLIGSFAVIVKLIKKICRGSKKLKVKKA